MYINNFAKNIFSIFLINSQVKILLKLKARNYYLKAI